MNFFAALDTIRLGDLALGAILSALLILVVCFFVIRLLTKLLKTALEKTHMEKGLRGFAFSAVQIALWAVAIILVASALGIDTASLVAVLSVAGLALSLAIQGIAGNLFSGVTILATKPFVTGDYVSIGGMEGTVQSVGLFHTLMRTVDNRTVYLPNSEITSGKVINFSHEPLRRVDISVCTSYDSPIPTVKAALMELMAAEPRVLQDPAPFAAVMEYKDSTVCYTMRCWVKTADYWGTFFALNDATLAALQAKGCEMCYNHVNVHIVEK